ncbi:hypothetical protein AMATHDRAFT_8984 [Amanita thiersii Skay4041]|uniref:Uncharacterized protein n=1 Tax=Amanita thiersii Skay4041 TaxID=703135 RepID=A0A2A9N8T2_9AGAR|nr:hypothetical protein AMATHDRAFT_8984 [Amanita thiersii Skay4041]
MTTFESNGQIIRAFVFAILSGMYIATFLHCTRWLVFNDDELTLRKRFSWLMLCVTWLIFALTMATLALWCTLPILLMRNEMQLFKTLLVSTAPIEALTSMLADIVLIYRCWVVYNRNWHVIYFPMFMMLVYTCFAALVLYYSVLIVVYSETSVISTEVYRAAVVLTYTCTIVLNIYTTSSIVFKIWRVTKESSGINTQRGLHFTIHVIADSGMLFTLSTILAFIMWLYTLKNTGPVAQMTGLISGCINYAMLGIAFNLIIIRVATQRASSDSYIDATITITEMYRRYDAIDVSQALNDQ